MTDAELLIEERRVVGMYRKLHKEDREEISQLEKDNFNLRAQISDLRMEER